VNGTRYNETSLVDALFGATPRGRCVLCGCVPCRCSQFTKAIEHAVPATGLREAARRRKQMERQKGKK
jgi:hypothetical protein